MIAAAPSSVSPSSVLYACFFTKQTNNFVLWHVRIKRFQIIGPVLYIGSIQKLLEEPLGSQRNKYSIRWIYFYNLKKYPILI